MNTNDIEINTSENEHNNGKPSILHENTEMSKKYPPLDPTKLKHNPFAQELVIAATLWRDPQKYIWSEEENKMVSSSALIERDKYTRMYRSATHRKMTMMLSPGALKLLMWMIQDVEDSNDWIRVMPEFYAKNGGKGASRTQYKKAVDELIAEGFICKTQYSYTYWINPAILSAGNRIEKYSDKVVVKNKW